MASSVYFRSIHKPAATAAFQGIFVFNYLHCSCALLAFLSSLLLHQNQISSSSSHHPLSLPFSGPLVTPLPLSNVCLLILLPTQTQLQQNFSTSLLLPPSSFPFHSTHGRTLVLPLAHTWAWGLILDLASNSSYPSSVSNSGLLSGSPHQ